MADPIRTVDAVIPLSRVAGGQQRPSHKQEREEPPRDKVSLSHPGDKRTLQLLLQILADSLGHRGISDDVRSMEHPDSPDQVAATLLGQINAVLVEPFLAVSGAVDPDAFSAFIQRIEDRLAAGKTEARAVFRALETASPKHLEYVDTVGHLVVEAMERLADGGRLELSLQPQG